MSDRSGEPQMTLNEHEPAPPDVDSNGVDRAQVRRMLALSPLERLRWLEGVVEDIVELRRLNEDNALR